MILDRMNGEDEHEIWLSGWEQQCCEAIQNQPAYEQSLAAENEYFQRRVWTSFQDSATAIAQLYRDCLLGHATCHHPPAIRTLEIHRLTKTYTCLERHLPIVEEAALLIVKPTCALLSLEKWLVMGLKDRHLPMMYRWAAQPFQNDLDICD
ncbi:hypothetical protein D910_07064 [Dendroctonus ponderosae]|uniref:Uncharacterized protein n=1 Tax=Dendroctonus ponderosae TaxID=77166 RepID=U4UGG8_DENPD|nr:hypothetical protein D910_07064 [Dendroctonus ponderosae]